MALDGRSGWHFPQTPEGVYAGYYPADSAEAVAHLETVRARGAEYLLFPSTAFWWLDHFSRFRGHLRATSTVVLENEKMVIFGLGIGD